MVLSLDLIDNIIIPYVNDLRINDKVCEIIKKNFPVESITIDNNNHFSIKSTWIFILPMLEEYVNNILEKYNKNYKFEYVEAWERNIGFPETTYEYIYKITNDSENEND